MCVVMLVCAQRVGHDDIHTDVWIVVGIAYALVAVGWGIVWASLVPEKRASFFKHDTLKRYLEREWDTRITSRAGWGEGLDAARAHVVAVWSHYYWPKEKHAVVSCYYQVLRAVYMQKKEREQAAHAWSLSYTTTSCTKTVTKSG